MTLIQRIEHFAQLAWAAKCGGLRKTAAMYDAEVARLNQIRFAL
jgi:hypothetical protein